MDIFNVLVLGIVEGFTEFLPISSTGHMILASKLMGLEQTEFLKTFELSVQFAAILAVLVLYWKKLFCDAKTFKLVVLAFIPTGIIGLFIYKFVKTFLTGNYTATIWSLLIGGILIILFEKMFAKKDLEPQKEIQEIDNIGNKRALALGACQALAGIPGVSRSATTIIAGRLMNLSKKTIVEFSFLLAIPTMAAVTIWDLKNSLGAFSNADLGLFAWGFLFSFVFAIIGIKFLLNFVQKHSFTAFGVYRIILALVFLLFVK